MDGPNATIIPGGMAMGMKGADRCPACKSTHIDYQGRDETGAQKWKCRNCGNRFTFKPEDKAA